MTVLSAQRSVLSARTSDGGRLWGEAALLTLCVKQVSAKTPDPDEQQEPIRRPTRARLRQRCDRPRPLARCAPQVRFRHSSPRVPESHGNPRISPEVRAEAPKSRAKKIPANSPLSVSHIADASLDRTQEVGGSSPPSSISRTPVVEPKRAFGLRRAWPLSPPRERSWHFDCCVDKGLFLATG